MLQDGRTFWDGVRNFQARNNLRAMSLQDRVLFYHSVSERRIMGVVRVTATAYPDPTAKEGDWDVVDLELAFALREPVTLERVKRDPALRHMVLVKQSRLSVQPVTRAQFDRIVSIGGRNTI